MKRIGDNVRQIERNIERKLMSKDIITLHSKLRLYFVILKVKVDSVSYVFFNSFTVKQIYDLCHITLRPSLLKMLVQYSMHYSGLYKR